MDDCCDREPNELDNNELGYLDDMLYFVKKIEKNHSEPAIVLSNVNRLRLVIEARQAFVENRREVEKHLSQTPAPKRGLLARIFGR